MRVINAMFGRGLGGIEQAFVDYSAALHQLGHSVLSLTHPAAQINSVLSAMRLPVSSQRNMGAWDMFAVQRLRALLKQHAPDVVIAHGNRAISLLGKASRGICPLVAVAHNYSLKQCHMADALFTITNDVAQHAIAAGVNAERITVIPNMVQVDKGFIKRAWGDKPPIIGSMGRFVSKKGFDDFIAALAILKDRGLTFYARLGGEGPEKSRLQRLMRKKNLEGILQFTGWVENKDAFFNGIDIFCLPSHHEPFGIVLLEAFAAKLPVVSTLTEGPRQIAQDQVNALLVPPRSPDALANALEKLAQDEFSARDMAKNAYDTVKSTYTADIIGKRIEEALFGIIRYTPYQQAS